MELKIYSIEQQYAAHQPVRGMPKSHLEMYTAVIQCCHSWCL